MRLYSHGPPALILDSMKWQALLASVILGPAACGPSCRTACSRTTNARAVAQLLSDMAEVFMAADGFVHVWSGISFS